MISHLEESITTGTRAMSGSVPMRLEEAYHRLLTIQHALVKIDINHLRAIFDLLSRHTHRFFKVSCHDQLAEGRQNR